MFRLISFNINSIRARLHQLEEIKKTLSPNIMALQETKVDDPMFPIKEIKKLGYHVEYFGQKTHYGVAILSTEKPIFVQKGLTDFTQKRFIHARYCFNNQEIDILNGYFPQGEKKDHPIKFPMKRKYYEDLTKYIEKLLEENRNIILAGDMNVAPMDLDIGIGEEAKKRWLQNGTCSFLPEEIKWYENLTKDLTDTYRHFYPKEQAFSWFDYKTKGFEDNPKRGLRIDHILCSKNLINNLQNADIDYNIRKMEKPSDHTAIWADFKF